MGSLQTLTADYDDTINFFLNGTRIRIDEFDTDWTLLDYLRGIGLKGTKLGCSEGGCGACTVVISQHNPTTNQIYHASINACLAPVMSVDGKHVITVEGIGNSDSPHPVQERLAKMNGSQCGFCTPGFVMSLYALLRNDPSPSEHAVEETFDGNLCRCTGYRPILDAAQTFSCGKGKDCCKSAANSTGCCKSEMNDITNAGGHGDTPPVQVSGCCKTKTNNVANGGCGLNGCCKSAMAEKDTTSRLTNGSTHKTLPAPEFIPYDPDTQLIFPPALRRHVFKPLAIGNKRRRWYRPVTVQQLLDIKNARPTAKLVGGSSETQIEVKFKGMRYEDSVYVGDIAELKQYAFKGDHVEIGANVSLTDLEGICDEVIERYGPARGQIFAAIRKQLRYFAGRQVRNVASPAGNIATASPISDLNPIFMASNTVLSVRSAEEDTTIPMGQFFKGYRKTALPDNAIIEKLCIPLVREEREFVRTYKQSKRKDDDIAIVTSALRVSLSQTDAVESVNLVYGGLGPTTVSAKQSEEYLVGKSWFDPATIEGAMSCLEKDFDLSSSVPGGMPTYRKTLALSFFYRFYHDVLSQIQGSFATQTLDQEAIPEIERAISTGSKDHAATVKYEQRILGKEVPHVAALKQSTGEAQYVDDIASSVNELHVCPVLATKVHARVLNIDFSAAMEIPGVVDYVRDTDLPSPSSNSFGDVVHDEPVFAGEEINLYGQPICAILARTARSAELGAAAVIVEYEELPTILSIEDAIEQKSFYDFFPVIQKGDVNGAFENAAHVFSGTAQMGGQEHFYLETQACLAIPKIENGELELHSSTQAPSSVQEHVSHVVGIPQNKILVRTKRMGGGFGGKETRAAHIACICAAAAQKTKRPIRCMLSRDTDISTSGQRHPFRGDWKVGVSAEGKLLAMEVDIYSNGGHFTDLSIAVMQRAMTHVDNCYMIPNVHIRGFVCRTNTVPNTAFRGFGGPQGLFITETFMAEIADQMHIPAEELKRMNLYQPSDMTHFNQELVDWHIPLMYEQVLEESDYARRRAAVDEYNREHKWSKRGLAIVPTKFGISFTFVALNQAGSLVHIHKDGSVLVAHAGTEMGQGLHTKVTMIAAEALGIPMSDVFISETSTSTVVNAPPTAASAGSDLNGYSVYNACQELNKRLKPYRERSPDAPLHEIAKQAWLGRVNLSAQGFYRTPDIGYNMDENKGSPFYYFTQGVAASEVEVDTLTGDWTPLRTDIRMDVGRSINPSIDYGQIEGAYVQGQGLFTTEESLWLRRNGQIATRGPGAYKIPTAGDIPRVFNVRLLKDVEWKNLRTIQRSRGVGEPPLFLGSTPFFAIRDALKAARKQWGVEDVVRLRSPATPERIRNSCCDPIVERSRVDEDKGDSFFVSI